MTIKETAYALGLKVRTIREWIKTGKIKAVKNGKSWYIPQSEIYKKEIIDNADKGREHSRRIKKGIEMGMLQRTGQDSKESV